MMRTAAALLCLLGHVIPLGCAPRNAPAGQPTEQHLVELFSWWTAPGEEEALQALTSLHQQRHPAARMFNAAVANGTRARELLATRLKKKDPPDFFQSNAHDLRLLVQKDPSVSQPLNRLFDDLGLSDVIYPELLEDLDVAGSTIAMPVNLHRENSLLFNLELFRLHGIQPPKTFEDLLRVCELLKAVGVVPFATSDQGWITRIFFSSIAMGAMGPEPYYRFMTGQESAEDSGVRKAVAVFKHVRSQYINPDAGADGFGWSQAASAVFHGDAAMIFHGDWVKGYFQSLGWEPGRDFSAMAAPGAQELFLYGIDVFALPREAVNAKSAVDFFKTISSVEGQEHFNQLKGSSSFRRDLDPTRLDPVAHSTYNDLNTARHRFLVRAPAPWDDAFTAFAKDLNEETLYQALVRYPPAR